MNDYEIHRSLSRTSASFSDLILQLLDVEINILRLWCNTSPG